MPEPTAGSRWNGDEWRWTRWSHAATGPRYIDVIVPHPDEEAERKRKIEAGARVIPFGFSRVLQEPAGEREPLTWEGDDA